MNELIETSKNRMGSFKCENFQEIINSIRDQKANSSLQSTKNKKIKSLLSLVSKYISSNHKYDTFEFEKNQLEENPIEDIESRLFPLSSGPLWLKNLLLSPSKSPLQPSASIQLLNHVFQALTKTKNSVVPLPSDFMKPTGEKLLETPLDTNLQSVNEIASLVSEKSKKSEVALLSQIFSDTSLMINAKPNDKSLTNIKGRSIESRKSTLKTFLGNDQIGSNKTMNLEKNVSNSRISNRVKSMKSRSTLKTLPGSDQIVSNQTLNTEKNVPSFMSSHQGKDIKKSILNILPEYEQKKIGNAEQNENDLDTIKGLLQQLLKNMQPGMKTDYKTCCMESSHHETPTEENQCCCFCFPMQESCFPNLPPKDFDRQQGNESIPHYEINQTSETLRNFDFNKKDFMSTFENQKKKKNVAVPSQQTFSQISRGVLTDHKQEENEKKLTAFQQNSFDDEKIEKKSKNNQISRPKKVNEKQNRKKSLKDFEREKLKKNSEYKDLLEKLGGKLSSEDGKNKKPKKNNIFERIKKENKNESAKKDLKTRYILECCGESSDVETDSESTETLHCFCCCPSKKKKKKLKKEETDSCQEELLILQKQQANLQNELQQIMQQYQQKTAWQRCYQQQQPSVNQAQKADSRYLYCCCRPLNGDQNTQNQMMLCCNPINNLQKQTNQVFPSKGREPNECEKYDDDYDELMNLLEIMIDKHKKKKKLECFDEKNNKKWKTKNIEESGSENSFKEKNEKVHEGNHLKSIRIKKTRDHKRFRPKKEKNRISIEAEGFTQAENRTSMSLDQTRMSTHDQNRMSTENRRRRTIGGQKRRTIRVEKRRMVEGQSKRTIRSQSPRTTRGQSGMSIEGQSKKTIGDRSNMSMRSQKRKSIGSQTRKSIESQSRISVLRVELPCDISKRYLSKKLGENAPNERIKAEKYIKHMNFLKRVNSEKLQNLQSSKDESQQGNKLWGSGEKLKKKNTKMSRKSMKQKNYKNKKLNFEKDLYHQMTKKRESIVKMKKNKAFHDKMKKKKKHFELMEHKKEPRTECEWSDSFESFRNYSKVSKDKPLSNFDVSCLKMRPSREKPTRKKTKMQNLKNKLNKNLLMVENLTFKKIGKFKNAYKDKSEKKKQ